MVKRREIDIELKWMLPFYYSIADFYIDRFDGFDELKRISKKNMKLYKKMCPRSSFENRGRLGKYWHGIQINIKTWGPKGPPPPPPGWTSGKRLEDLGTQ
jgi:hypothetical protein